jgi:hypothetical protein
MDKQQTAPFGCPTMFEAPKLLFLYREQDETQPLLLATYVVLVIHGGIEEFSDIRVGGCSICSPLFSFKWPGFEF